MSTLTNETFTSRWGIYAAALGVAIGTGNIWRFPRIMVQNGGGAFLIALLVGLCLWAIPIMIIEMTLGKSSRRGTIGAFISVMGPQFSWMGAFVGWWSAAIMFYYAVVTTWCLKYMTAATLGALKGIDGRQFWITSTQSYTETIFFLVIVLGICFLVLYRGVVRGIERFNRYLVPGLLIMLIIGAIRSVTLPGAGEGLSYMFTPKWSDLLHYRTWLEAITQAAWSTGAGWGLLLTYGAYMRESDKVSDTAVIAGLGDVFAAILAGLVIVPTVFALQPQNAELLLRTSGPASTGLTFIWIPELFHRIPGGRIFLSLFFLALTSAALTSLIAMLEMSARNFIDMGWTRKRALILVCSTAFICALPSAISLEFLGNQDWVWGVGLLISGCFIVIAAISKNIQTFRKKYIQSQDFINKVGKIFDNWTRFGIPLLFIIVLGWWFMQAVLVFEKGSWWDPFRTYSVGTCILQWGLVIALFIFINNILVRLQRPYHNTNS